MFMSHVAFQFINAKMRTSDVDEGNVGYKRVIVVVQLCNTSDLNSCRGTVDN